jgi:hypothetical protein
MANRVEAFVAWLDAQGAACRLSPVEDRLLR